jgi:LuxR family transcriptional regulator, maltose regulon positive regulatory protein
VADSVSVSQPLASRARLLRTKLFVPQAHPDLVPRDRLLRRLDDACRARVTLVSAPAGFGKSTLLSTWIAQRGLPVGWVSLDARDNDPIRFWSYVVAALEGTWEGPWGIAWTMLQSPQPPPIEGVLIELLNALAGVEGAVLLCLDDIHEIVDAAIHESLSFLVEHLPPHISLVLSGRSDPPLPLAQLRARRQLVEFRASDLRFTADEAEDFLSRVMGLTLRAEEVATLASRTEGWVAGLQLAALSIQDVVDTGPFLANFSGEHRFIFDYLAQEIIARQPVERRSLMIATSLLSRMTGGLCTALTGHHDGQAVLEALERDNLFVSPLDRERRWYRYHGLFHDFLRAQVVDFFSPEAIAALHRRAAVWYADHGDVPEAVEHALEAQDFAWARDLIDGTLPEMLKRGELRLLLGWLDRLPPSLVRDDRHLSMAAAWAHLAMGRQEAVEPHLRNVERVIGAEAGNKVTASEKLSLAQRGALAEICCIRATLSFNRADLAGVIAISERALAYLGEDVTRGVLSNRPEIQSIAAFNSAVAQEFSGHTEAALTGFATAIALLRETANHHLLPLAISHFAQLHVLQGHLREAATIYQEALHEVERHGTPSPLSGMAYVGLGTLLYQWNELDRAAEYLQQGIDMGRPWSHWESLVGGYIGLGRIDLARGDAAQAMRRLDELAETTQLLKMEWAWPSIHAHRALLSAWNGKVEAARDWVRTCELPQEGEIPSAIESHALTLARVLLAQGALWEARATLDRLLAGAERAGRLNRVIEASVIQAAVYKAGGDEVAALGALERALGLAESEGYVRVFLDEGAPMQLLLKQLAPRVGYAERLLREHDGTSPRPIASGLSDALRLGRDRPAYGLLDDLTERELEVLALMAEGLTNQAIADRLYVSINTVKTHAKHIYEKLGVRNRAQATLRAVDLGLL